jgi:hypothetical protein
MEFDGMWKSMGFLFPSIWEIQVTCVTVLLIIAFYYFFDFFDSNNGAKEEEGIRKDEQVAKDKVCFCAYYNLIVSPCTLLLHT